MIPVYQLRKDKERIKNIQEASLESEHCGLQLTHGLLGSKEWWYNIKNGLLKTFTVKGIISHIETDDFPVFKVRSTDGQVTKWAMLSPSHWYHIGYHVEIDYVIQYGKAARAKAFNTLETKIILEIRINGSEKE